MKWFLFFVVLNLGHKYAYGEEIVMFVNVNDTVDLKVEKEAEQGILYSCKAQLYSDTGVFIKDYTLMEKTIWKLNKNDQIVMKYFEFFDYKGSCSFTISPFPSEFYGHWIINTTTDIGEDEEVVYNYKYQEFYLTTPPKENTGVLLQKNISYPKDDHTNDAGTFFLSINNNEEDYHLEDPKDTENHSTHNIECRNTNPISLRPKKVSGQMKKCIAFHHHDIVQTKNATESDNQDKTIYEIYPDTSHEFVFTGNNNSCQFKIIEMKHRYLETRDYKLKHALYERWEIITYYEDQLTNQLSQRRDTFKIHLISKNYPRPQEKKTTRVQPMIQGPRYIKLEKPDTAKNSTVSKFIFQLAKYGQTEKINILPEDNFYYEIADENNYGYSITTKHRGYYDSVFERTNKTYEIYEYMYIYAANKEIQHPKKSFNSPLRVAWRRGCNNILAIEGSMFPFWLTDNVPENTYDQELRVVVQMPNGTLIETHYTQNSSLATEFGTDSLSRNAMLERKNLYKNMSIFDNGFWKINYQSKLWKDPRYSRFTAFYSVSTWDSTHVKVIVDMTTENSSISIYNIQKNPKRCLLLSTNGTVIAESEPIVHNVSRNSICLRQIKEIDNLNECEFKINQSDSDYGMKTFSIDYGNFTINRTIILQSNFEGMKKYNKISNMQDKNSHFVIPNDEFLVNCSHNRPLLFCRIETPTEKVTHITDKNALEAGNCWLLVKNASEFYHNGTWKCQLAFDESNIGSTIIEYFFSVRVRNFHVSSRLEYIYENNKAMIKQVVFRCELSSNFKISDAIGGHQVDYCSWSHPDGTIISNNSNVYTVNTSTSSSCDLTIHSLYEKDFGHWSCSADLKLLTNLPLHHTINLVRHPRMLILKNYTITPELKRNFTLYSTEKQVASFGPGLDCHIFPAVRADMIGCKWIKINSNNNNFTANDEGYHVVRKNDSVCELRFLRWKESGDETDYGKWRCCIDIVDSVDQTICQDIELPNEVYRPPKEGIGIYILILLVIIFLLVIFCSCFYSIIKKLKKRLAEKREKQRQTRRSRAANQRRQARSASRRNRTVSSSHESRARSSSQHHALSSPSSQQDSQASRIMSARIQAEPNIYV